MSDAPTVPMKGDGSLRAQAPSVPTEGREAAVLVPREPTEAMIEAGAKAAQSAGAFSVPWSQEARVVWSAMIAATQQATGGEGGCPRCSGDCSAANPPVLDCPLATQQATGEGVPEGMMTLADELEDKADELDMMDARGQVWGLEDVSDLMRRARAALSTQQAVSPPEGVWRPTAAEIANCRAGIADARAGLRKVFGDDVPDGLGEIAVDADWLERVCDHFAPDAIGEEKGAES